MGNEGGYQHDLDDKGNTPAMGTYKGVAPASWPKWEGWKSVKAVLDNMTTQPPFDTREYYNWLKAANKNLAANSGLQRAVRVFYEANFWTANRYGEIDSQQVATWMFDRAVNCGSGAANKMLQRALGIPGDGAVGKQTLRAVNAADVDDLLARLHKQAEAYYRAIAKKNPSQAKFMAGWLKRLSETA
jgi:lysozyme family protein